MRLGVHRSFGQNTFIYGVCESVLAGGGLDTGKAQILAKSSASLSSIDFVLVESILRVVSILSTPQVAVQGKLSNLSLR